MSTGSPVRQLAEQARGVVDKAMRSLQGPFDDFGPFIVAVPGDGSQPRLVDLPNELLTGEAAGKADVVQGLVRPLIVETGAKRIAWVGTVFTLDLEGKSEAEANEAIRRLMASGIADHPDRRESVIVNAMDAETVETWVARVGRTAIAPPTLGQWEDFGEHADRRLLGLEAQSFYGEAELLEPLRAALRESPAQPRTLATESWNEPGRVVVELDADGFVITLHGGAVPIGWLARARTFPTLEAARGQYDALGPLMDSAEDLGAWRGLPSDHEAPVIVVVGAQPSVDRALESIGGEPHTVGEADVRFFVGRRLARMA
ncbi:hypothetical protein OJ997_05510 [Solirubrobacter phytolaccae]|uniref:Uncharacterized protein n=1 Tax=Solirubrobacter phytolaccae TaxID=1404360 RepID=A0A9X3N8U9_9ACTN|nr:hypothetical protein [Solirubrobacter phytolaccae]MDA0179741.1 hypothetical protein [Solirubrobacter phytolaccae]